MPRALARPRNRIVILSVATVLLLAGSAASAAHAGTPVPSAIAASPTQVPELPKMPSLPEPTGGPWSGEVTETELYVEDESPPGAFIANVPLQSASCTGVRQQTVVTRGYGSDSSFPGHLSYVLPGRIAVVESFACEGIYLYTTEEGTIGQCSIDWSWSASGRSSVDLAGEPIQVAVIQQPEDAWYMGIADAVAVSVQMVSDLEFTDNCDRGRRVDSLPFTIAAPAAITEHGALAPAELMVGSVLAGTFTTPPIDSFPGSSSDYEFEYNGRYLDGPAVEYVALGDSYSSGFGNGDYELGTHKDLDDNDCQRSAAAYSATVARVLDVDREFHACQGAVTDDFFNPRNSTWFETAQLDHLTSDTDLVTLSIGGNDTGFSKVVTDCVLELPFTTCYDNRGSNDVINESLAALDGRSASVGGVHSYDEVFSAISLASPSARVVAVGYPHFFSELGEDGILGHRCEGVQIVDQRWIVEKIDELNSIEQASVERNGYFFANPTDRFVGHELCASDDDWIFGAVRDGKFHPTTQGQSALADEVLDTLRNEAYAQFLLATGETVDQSFTVAQLTKFLWATTRWPGSTVRTTLVSPSGVSYSSGSGAGASNVLPTSEQFTIADPEPGVWTAHISGVDLAEGGENVTFVTHQDEAPNQRPTAAVTAQWDHDTLSLSADGSRDADGTIAQYEWMVQGSDWDVTLTGPSAQLDSVPPQAVSVTLIVTDDRGLTEFSTKGVPVITYDSPSVLGSTNQVSFSILSGPGFDATADVSPAAAIGTLSGVAATRSDTNDDGVNDTVFSVPATAVGLPRGQSDLCLRGTLIDESPFEYCASVTTEVGESPAPSPDPTPGPPATNTGSSAGPLTPASTGTGRTTAVQGRLGATGTDAVPAATVAALLIAFGLGTVLTPYARRSRRSNFQRGASA